MAGIHSKHKGMSKDGIYHNVSNEWHAAHCTHCLPVAQLPKLAALWTMTGPSEQKPPVSYSQVTAELPAGSRYLLVAVGCFAVFVPVLLAVCGLSRCFHLE